MFLPSFIIAFAASCHFPLLVASQECFTRPSQLERPPRFICSVEILVERNADCSANIVENITLPHTTGNDIVRYGKIQWEFQRLAETNLSRDGDEVSLKEERTGPESVRFLLPSKNDTESVSFELSYRVSNYVMLFSEECTESGEKNENENVIRWSFGFWDLEVARVSVRFVTRDSRASLSLTGNRDGVETETKSEQDFTASAVRIKAGRTFQLYVRESNVGRCAQELKCYDGEDVPGRAPPTWVIITGPVAGGLVIICILGIVKKYRRKRTIIVTPVTPVAPVAPVAPVIVAQNNTVQNVVNTVQNVVN